MRTIYLKGKFYLVFYDDAFGSYGQEITAETYDALKDILDEDKIKCMNDELEGTKFVDERGYLK